MSATNKPGLPRETPKEQVPPASSLTPGALLAAPGAFFTNSPIFFWGVLGATLIMWASAFVAIPVAVRDVSPEHVIIMRLLITSSLLLPFFLKSWKAVYRPAFKAHWKIILGMAFTGIALYLVALTFGQRTVGAGPTSLLLNLTPLVTGFLAAMFLKEPFLKRLVFGGIISFVGVAVLIVGHNTGFGIDYNALLVLIATVSQSAYFVIQRHLSKKFSAFQLTTLTILPGALMILPLAGGVFNSLADLTPASTAAIIYLGAGAGLFPYIGWAYVISRLPAAKATLYLYYIPVLATLMGWLVLDETITVSFLFSAALIILGVMIGAGVVKTNPFRKILKTTPQKDCKDAP